MLNKARLLLKNMFCSYCLSEEEISFCQINKNKWDDIKSDKIEVLVEGFLDSPTSIVEKARLARAASSVLECDVIVNIRGIIEKSSNVSSIYRSFGLNNFNCWWRNYLNPIVMIPAIISSIYIFRNIKTGERLTKYKLEGLLIGDLIYDSIIRNIPNSYTINELKVKTHLRLVLRSMVFFYGNKRLLNRYDFKVFVTSHNVYAEYGMMCRQAHYRGVVVLVKDMDAYKIYGAKKNINEHFLKIDQSIVEHKLSKSDFKREKEYFNERVLGLSKQIDVQNAYTNKRVYTKSETLRLNNAFDLNKKNIFIMAHAFSDAPHVGEGILFKDYYDFLEKTLIAMNNNFNVNCYVKSHPSSYMWGEEGGVESILKRHGLSKICILPNDYSTKSILASADVIVTAKGTAGLEFSCAGIPAITAGNGYYHGFGICHEPSTLDEYYSLLNNSHLLEKLDAEIMNKALVVMYFSFKRLFHSDVLPKEQIKPGDNYANLYRSKFAEMNGNMLKGVPMQDSFYEMVVSDLKKEFYG